MAAAMEPLMAAMERGRAGGRLGLSTLLSGVVAGLLGLVAGPALAQAGAAVTGGATGLGPWESLGMGGLAVALSLWGLREASQKRLEEAQRYAERLAEEKELRITEEREHSAAVERIYASKAAADARLFDQLREFHKESQEMMRLALQRNGDPS